MNTNTRREYLLSTIGVLGGVTLAGCLGDDDSEEGDGESNGGDQPEEGSNGGEQPEEESNDEDTASSSSYTLRLDATPIHDVPDNVDTISGDDPVIQDVAMLNELMRDIESVLDEGDPDSHGDDWPIGVRYNEDSEEGQQLLDKKGELFIQERDIDTPAWNDPSEYMGREILYLDLRNNIFRVSLFLSTLVWE